MINEKEIIARIRQLMDFHGLSASAFAARIEVQRSGISHIISGRNRPSLDFIMKVRQAFPEVNLEWLLGDDGDLPQSMSSIPLSASVEDWGLKRSKAGQPRRIILVYEDRSFEILEPHS